MHKTQAISDRILDWLTLLFQSILGILVGFTAVLLLSHTQAIFNECHTTFGWKWNGIQAYLQRQGATLGIIIEAGIFIIGIILFIIIIRFNDSRRDRIQEKHFDSLDRKLDDIIEILKETRDK